MKDIYEQLRCYTNGNVYPMHMPGHKRNPEFNLPLNYCLDVTEVEGTDNLHQPEGMLKTGMERMAAAYQADASFYLVNGSTAGIQIAIASCCELGDTILMGRNCHKSVYNMVSIQRLRPEYLYPMIDTDGICMGITRKQVEAAIQGKDISCVVITSPTYEGYISEIREIASLLHEKQIPLIVDEAHGAHLIWHERFPESAVQQGADLVIQSFHKTLPAPTQTGVLHWNQGIVSLETVRWNEQIFQTSSPSYLFMAGIDHCLSVMFQQGKELFTRYFEHFDSFYDKIKVLKHLYVKPISKNRDISKIVIVTKNASCNGMELAAWLREKAAIETEMALPGYVLAMTSVADTREGFDRLAAALILADEEFGSDWQEPTDTQVLMSQIKPEQIILPGEACRKAYENVTLTDAIGRVAGEYIYHYPPGIPLVVPGERFTNELYKEVKANDVSMETIRVITS